jgi:hypothetical protein
MLMVKAVTILQITIIQIIIVDILSDNLASYEFVIIYFVSVDEMVPTISTSLLSLYTTTLCLI